MSRLGRGPRRALVATACLQALAYPRSLALGLLSGGIWILVVYGVWRFVVGSGERALTLEGLRAYVLTAFVLNALIGIPIEMQVALRVRRGEIVTDLVRPLSFFDWQIHQVLGQALVELGAALVVVALVGPWLAPIATPDSLAHWILLLVTAVLGAGIQLGVVYLSIVASMLTMHGQGVLWIRRALVGLLSGFLVPLELMPSWLRHAAQLFPFRDIIHTPASVAAGTLGPDAAPLVLIRQAVWIVLLFVAGHALFRVARRTVVIQGG